MNGTGFLVHSTYRIESARPVVQLWGRLDDGRTFLARDTRQLPHFWIRERDADAAKALGAGIAAEAIETRRVAFDGAPLARVDVDVPSAVPPLRTRLVAAGIDCFEADVRFAMRLLMDRAIRTRLAIAGEPRPPSPDERVSLVFDDPEIGPAGEEPGSRERRTPLSLLSLDIETDPQAQRLLSIALHGCGHSEVLLLTPRGYACPEGATAARDERTLVETFAERVRTLDPDVITGWNVVDFDLTVLAKIAERSGARLAIARGPGELRIRPARGFWDQASASLPGRVVLDGIHALKSSFVRMESYALDAVARTVLGEGKLITGHDRAEEILRLFEEDREKLVAYNLTDARLVTDILAKLALLDLAVERSLLTGMPLDRVGASIAAFEFLYLSELSKRGIAAPTGRPFAPPQPAVRRAGASVPPPGLPLEPSDDELPAWQPERAGTSPAPTPNDEEGELGDDLMLGGHVLEPRPGLYEWVVVLDFKSLYPSIIRTFQIDPLGFVPTGNDADDPVVAPNGARFRRAPGILPGILDTLFPRRERAKAERRPLESQAIKILMNSFYGVLGTSACRFFNPDVANAITSFGRELLLWTKASIEAQGHEVLYGDTDSLFVRMARGAEPDLDSSRARGLGEKLRERVNEELARHIHASWRVESKLEIELDTLYRKLLLLPLRHGTGGARKRYAGLVEEGGSKRVILTGMEAVRSDWTELAKTLQRGLYERLFAGEAVEEFLRRTVDEVRAGRLDGELVYRKVLRKDAARYTKTTPPHVAAARVTGAAPGTAIAYVMTRGGPEPAERRSSPLDYEHYVERQIRPVAEPVLAVLGLDFDRAVGIQLELLFDAPRRRKT